MAAGIVGGGTAIASGSLEKGLMAGLGAYGGAGLATSLSAAAPAIAAESVVPEAVTSLADIGTQAATEAAAPGLLGTGTANIATAAPEIYTAVPPPVFSAAAPTPTPIALGPTPPPPTPTPTLARMGAGLEEITSSGDAFGTFAGENKMALGSAGIAALSGMTPEPAAIKEEEALIRPYTYSREKIPSAFEDVAGEPMSSKERRYFTDSYTALKPYKAPGPEYGDDDASAEVLSLFEKEKVPQFMAAGGPVESMSGLNAIGANTGYPQSDINVGAYATPYQQPISRNVVTGAQDAAMNPYTGQAQFAGGGFTGGGVTEGASGPLFSKLLGKIPAQEQSSNVGGYSYDPVTQQYSGSGNSLTGGRSDRDGFGGMFDRLIGDITDQALSRRAPNGSIGGYEFNPATQQYSRGMAGGGLSSLGGYSDGGQLLRGPGDGVSDNIPARIGGKQEARLADGEFVVPARIVSELGNGSTEAGARQLYAMMDRVQKARNKSMGKNKVAANTRAAKHLPA
jgi:hypothetical protein